MTGKRKQSEAGWPWYGKIIFALLVFITILSFAILFITSMSQNPDLRGQIYLDYQNEGVTLLIDWEVGVVCYLVEEVGVSCLPLAGLNKDRILGMMYAEPVKTTAGPDNVPHLWRLDEMPATPEGEQ